MCEPWRGFLIALTRLVCLPQVLTTVLRDRRKLFRQIAELMNDDAVYVPWHYSSDFKGLHPKVKGFVHAQDGIIAFQDLYLQK